MSYDKKIIRVDKETDCEFCEGTGLIEKTTSTCDDSTGYNTILEGTGIMERCFSCNAPDDDAYDQHHDR